MIETVISDYVQLKKHGRNYLGICPFHEDSKPSLNVIVHKEIFKCFACGVGGNVLKFISKIENINHEQAQTILQTKYQVTNLKPVPVIKPSVNQEWQQRLFLINEETARFYHYQLAVLQNKTGYDYCQERKITADEISKFQLGYASSNNELLQFLTSKGFTIPELITAGVIRKDFHNNMVDVFHNRIVFPIKNICGKVTGFSARAIDKHATIKYLNSCETVIFKKYQNLYNINNCVNNKTIFVVEGYMDAIACHKLGLNAVALMGVNCSSYQTKLLANNFKEIKLFLDNDKAGISAAKKISEQLATYRHLQLTIINNPTPYKDMDELLHNFSQEQLLQALHYQPQLKELKECIQNDKPNKSH